MARIKGTCTGTYGSRYNLYLDYTLNSQSVTNNTSNITLRQWARASDSTYRAYNLNPINPYAIKINGVTKVSGKKVMDFRNMAVVELGSWRGNISHNADGKKTISISSNFSILNVSSLTGGSVGPYSWTLPTIPRMSKPTLSSASFDLGSSITIYTNRASSSFTHTIRYSFGGASGTIATGVGTSVSWTPPLSLANRIPNAASGSGYIYCDTYSGGTKIGTESVKFTGKVPSSIVPSFDTITHSEYVTDVADKVGAYVQSKSRLDLAITGQAGSYGSTIKGYSITFDGKSYSSRTVTSSVIEGSGDLTITGKITDSRGRTCTKSVTVNVLPYSVPKITKFTLQRCDSNGTPNVIGEYVKVTCMGSVSSLVNVTEKNNLTYRIKSKERGAVNWITKKSTTISGLSLVGSDILGTYAAVTSFDFHLEIVDKFYTTIAVNVLPTGKVTMSWGKDGIGIGKVRESGTLDVLGEIYSDGKLVPNILYGSNDYGSWVRWSNGLQVCWYYGSESIAIENAYDSLYQGTYSFMFPASFYSAPAVSIGQTQWGTGASWGMVSSTTEDSVSLRFIDVKKRNATSMDISYIAIGWWK